MIGQLRSQEVLDGDTITPADRLFRFVHNLLEQGQAFLEQLLHLGVAARLLLGACLGMGQWS
jgi:hypothetical protein